MAMASNAAPPGDAPARPTASDIATLFGGEKAVTRPWRDAVMGFSQPTRVTEILISGGQEVKKGALMIRGEDAEDAALLKLQKMRADTDWPVQKAQKTSELAQIEFDNFKSAAAERGTAPLEVDRARLSAEGAKIDLELAKQQQEQEVIQVDRVQARLDRMRIAAPFDGQIDVVMADVGQSMSENEKVIRVVDVQRLWIDVPVPTGQTIEYATKSGDPAWVLMDLPGPAKLFLGKVIEVSPVADAASATRRVRVEVPNPDRVVAGVACWVRLAEPAPEWKERVTALSASDSTNASSRSEPAR